MVLLNNRVLLKRVAITAIALCFFISAFAQKGEKAVGGHLSYYTEIDFYMTGIGAKFRYNISNPIRLEGAFTYFFPKEDESFYFYSPKIHLWDLSVNGHYLFPVSNKFVIYPLVGMSVLKSTATASVLGVSASVSESRVGFNFGGGLDFKVSDNIGINVEPKLVIGGGETPSGIQIQIIISAGAVYNF